MKCKEIQPLFMDYLYDEIADQDRQLLLAHLSECELCQNEFESLKKTSQVLQQWEDVDPDFNVVMVTEKVTWLSHLKARLIKLLPKPKRIAFGLVYAVIAIFLFLAIANTEISYRQGEFKMRMGLLTKPTAKTTANDLLNQQVLEKLQQENYYLTNSLIQQSEARQRKELAATVLQLKQDFAQQRVEDLNLVGFGLDNIERRTVRQLKRTDESLNEIIQLISAQRR